MNSFREKTPVRTQLEIEKYTDGLTFKQLRNDFNGRCGYCDTSDKYMTINYFEPDHFKPRKKFIHLEHEYSNLVYSCKNCNMFKSSYWVCEDENICENESGTEGMIDPCSKRYTRLFHRKANGQVRMTEDPMSKFIYKRLKLYLQKRTFYFQVDQIDYKIDKIINHKNKDRLTVDEMLALYKIKDEIAKLVNNVELAYKLKE
jgi:uncharacterized protein (TIGR02646 family)